MIDHPQLFDALAAPIEDALRASIQRFGVLVPIVKDQHGTMIDGRHRARIADVLGVDYRVDRVTVRSDAEAAEIQRTLNADRRHLSGDELREHIVFLAEQVNERGEGVHSEATIGKVAGVSQQYVNKTLKDNQGTTGCTLPERRKGADGKSYPANRPTTPPISDDELTELDPQTWTRPSVVTANNRRGDERAGKALSTLGEHAPTGTSDVKRIERLAREREAERKRAEPVEPRTEHGSVDLRHGDFRDVLSDLSDVDAIITDPPYPQEYISLYGDLSELAAHILAPHGVLVVMAGQWWLRDYLAELDKHLAYRWTAAYIAQGARTRVHAAKVGTGWKPLFIYQRRDAHGTRFLVDDLFDAANGTHDGVDKQFHHWGQSETGIAEQVERFTQHDELVVDPFLGGGTTAVACRDLGRRFVGCDSDAAAVSTSRERVA